MTTIQNTGPAAISADGEFPAGYTPSAKEPVAARYENRLNDLTQWAEEDEIQPNSESAQLFWQLFDKTLEFGEASLTMTDTGDIRARWGSVADQCLAIEFLPGGQVEYAVVTHNEGDSRLQWNADVCPVSEIDAVLALARAAGIESIWQDDRYPTAIPC